jgi:hypothetical protein
MATPRKELAKSRDLYRLEFPPSFVLMELRRILLPSVYRFDLRGLRVEDRKMKWGVGLAQEGSSGFSRKIAPKRRQCCAKSSPDILVTYRWCAQGCAGVNTSPPEGRKERSVFEEGTCSRRTILLKTQNPQPLPLWGTGHAWGFCREGVNAVISGLRL